MLIVMSLYMYIEHLHGVHVSDEKLFSLSGDDGPQLLEWGENGFRMQVPEGATSGPCDIAVKVIIAGQFEFPVNTQLVSAVYAISPSRKLKKPVQLEIQHCVSIASKQLRQSIGLVRAKCNLLFKPALASCIYMSQLTRVAHCQPLSYFISN